MATLPQLDSRYDAPEPPLQLDKLIAFQQRLFFDMGAGLTVLAAYLGDRLGLFRALAELGPSSARDFAERRKTDPDMTAEWLRVMLAAGYVEHAADGDVYSLAPEHAMILANDGGPMCLAGGLQQLGGFAEQLPSLLHALRNGGGLPQSAYSTDLREGMERLSATWLEHELPEHWIANLPVAESLRNGATVLDVGCGAGRALVALAKAFPASRFIGYDVFPPAIERAQSNAAAAGVAGRVTFELRDATKGIPGEFDLVTAFDSLHDLPDPRDGLVALGRALKKDGTLLVLELATDANAAEDAGPAAVVLHATKLFYNLPVALAASGSAPGKAAFPEPMMRALCRQAGLVLERTIAARNPLHKLYVIKPAKSY